MPTASSSDAIKEKLAAAVAEASVSDADAVDAKRGSSTETVLKYVADCGAEGLPWANGLRDVFVVEVSRAATILFRTVSAQAANGQNNKSLGNTARYELDTRLQEFAADNEFIVGELRGLTRTPFTAQRLAEVLLNPLQYHTLAPGEDLRGLPLVHEGADGAAWEKQVQQLRADLLQNVIRKCVLVTPTGVA
jgi:hypothetical protein